MRRTIAWALRACCTHLSGERRLMCFGLASVGAGRVTVSSEGPSG